MGGKISSGGVSGVGVFWVVFLSAVAVGGYFFYRAVEAGGRGSRVRAVSPGMDMGDAWPDAN